MERSTIYLLSKRGTSQRQIARELGYSRVTVARVLSEPPDRPPTRRQRARLREEILTLHALVTEHGPPAVLSAIAQAERVGGYSAVYVAALLATPAERARSRPVQPVLILPGVPQQAEIDRQLSHYEVYVQRGVAAWPAGAVPA
jgi:hypothetical protein